MKATIALLALAAMLASRAAAASTHQRLIATVGVDDAYKITLRTPNGELVRFLKAGIYTIVVHDDSRMHNFALGDRTTNRRLFTTGVPFVGIKVYTLKLAPGSYADACSVHFQTMHGSFVVTPAH